VGHLLANRPDLADKKIQRTVTEMNKIPPAALVERYEQYTGTIDIATRTTATSWRLASPAARRRS